MAKASLIGLCPEKASRFVRWAEEHASGLFVLALSIGWSVWIGLDPTGALDRWELATLECRSYFEEVKAVRPVSLTDWGGSAACVHQSKAAAAHYAGLFASVLAAFLALKKR